MTTNFMNWGKPGTAVVTGASAGLGVEFARQLSSQGFNLALTARREDRLQSVAEGLRDEFGVTVDILVADHSDATANQRVMDYILACDDLDVLVNNAGYGIIADFADTATQDHVDMITVHCTAPTQFAHTAVQGMKQRDQGTIINVSSVGALLKMPPGVMYTATKEYMNTFSETLQANLAETSIRIQALCPGFTYTEFHDVDTMSGFDREWFPKETWMTAEEVISLSLAAFDEPDVIVITGQHNKDFVTQRMADNPRFRT